MDSRAAFRTETAERLTNCLYKASTEIATLALLLAYDPLLKPGQRKIVEQLIDAAKPAVTDGWLVSHFLIPIAQDAGTSVEFALSRTKPEAAVFVDSVIQSTAMNLRQVSLLGETAIGLFETQEEEAQYADALDRFNASRQSMLQAFREGLADVYGSFSMRYQPRPGLFLEWGISR